MDFVLNGVTRTLNGMGRILGGFSFTRNLGADVARISTYIQKANAFIPVSEAMTVLALFISVQLALIAYYWITRAINLLRGAG